MNYPNPPIQTSSNLYWLRKVAQAGRSNRIRPGNGYKVQRSTAGISLRINKGRGVSHTPFHVKSVEPEYLVCRTWDGENEGVTDIKIAKPPELRNSVDTETIDGDTINYSAYDNTAQTRLADDGTNQETQVIVPRYLVDTVIFAFKANSCALDEDGNTIGLQDANVAGRAWAAVPP